MALVLEVNHVDGVVQIILAFDVIASQHGELLRQIVAGEALSQLYAPIAKVSTSGCKCDVSGASC